MAQAPSIVKLGDEQYKLVPLEYKGHRPSKLRAYDDPTFRAIGDYKYKRLEGSRKKIRLLQLKSGTIDAPDIHCELIEADYDNRFHIPTAFGAQEKYKSELDTRGMTQRQIDMDDRRVFQGLIQYEIKYEALSWCWGTDAPTHMIFINEKDNKGQEKLYKLRVREQLALALKYLRYPDRSRTLWIDAICINQDDSSERNHQVQLMSRIYTRAEEVSIWLGDSDDSSKLAIPFIKDEIMELENFETLFSNNRYAAKWRALVILMQRDWFSRRWVVQEIALATKATIYCGQDSVEWKQFAVAIERFVEVESATRRLSELMQYDAKLRHVRGWFEYVSALGASLLVDATGKVFRTHSSAFEEDMSDRSEDDTVTDPMEKARLYQNIDLLDRRKFLSLEYLVSTFFIFGASEPRDAVYSMLALSRDAAPLAGSSPSSSHRHYDPTLLLLTTCEPWLAAKPFLVDYQRPYTEFCKDFVSFAIERRREQDPSQALDILCRPWALPPKSGKSVRLQGGIEIKERRRLFPQRNPLLRPWKRLRLDPDKRGVYLEEDDPRSMEEYWDDVAKPDQTWTRLRERYFSSRRSQNNDNERVGGVVDDFPLPSWVAQVSRAPTSLYFSPGIEPRTVGRSNADPLVGNPKDGHRNYSASQTRPPNLLKFRRRPWLKHYSLFVSGFVIDEVEEVMAASQGGCIPSSWLEMAGWYDVDKNPPSAFWRTLVANRGRDNGSPPYYYAKACRESAIRGGIAGGRIDTAALINNERSPIVIEFCRRVHASIWNRHLFKTKTGRLGLASNVEKGDKLCILYGCTVPVVLHSHRKTDNDLAKEKEEDSIMALKRSVQRMEMLRRRKAAYISKSPSPREREDNRRAGKMAVGFIEYLERTQSRYGELDRESEAGNHDKNHEGCLARAELPDEGKDSGEDEFSDTVEHQPQTGSSAEPYEARSEHSLVSKSMPIRRFETQYLRDQEAAWKEDLLLWYELRGDCYLHGMMDGEAIREQYQRMILRRNFELR